jgi:hypothetical protein
MQDNANDLRIAKMFNAVERPIKQLISSLVGVEEKGLFDDGPTPEPIVLQNKNKKNRLLVIKLASGRAKCKYDLTKHSGEKFIGDILDFYKYSVNQVYGSIVKTIDNDDIRTYLSNYLLIWDGNGNFNVVLHDEVQQNLRLAQKNIGNNLQRSEEINVKKTKSSEEESELDKLNSEFGGLVEELTKYQTISESKKYLDEVELKTNVLKTAPNLRLVFTDISKQGFISHNSSLPTVGNSIFD